MKKQIALCLLMAPALAWSQSTGTTAVGSSTTSVESAATSKNWGASVTVIGSKNALTDQQEEEANKTDLSGAKVFESEMQFNLSYKLDSTWTAKMQHRVFYTRTLFSNYQTDAANGNLRLYMVQNKISFLSANPEASSFSYRLTLPTTFEARTSSNVAAFVAFIPVMAWSATTNVTVAYDGLYQVAFYHDKNTAADASPYAQTLGSNMRDWGMVFNEVTAEYAFNDQWSVYQTLGHEYDVMNTSKTGANQGVNMVGSFSNISSGVNWNPTKAISTSFGITQYYPFTDNSRSVDPKFNLTYVPAYMLYRPEQSSYQLTAAVKY